MLKTQSYESQMYQAMVYTTYWVLSGPTAKDQLHLHEGDLTYFEMSLDEQIFLMTARKQNYDAQKYFYLVKY